jgi:hypothetical protein
VSFEDRQDLLGHKSGRITTHYSQAELSNLIAAAEKVCESESRKNSCNDMAALSCERCKRLRRLARPEGFEPPTTWFEV